ncbi:hypothetical protein PENTCL1PPCAC_9020, partial [Pristionchus entomophagus]
MKFRLLLSPRSTLSHWILTRLSYLSAKRQSFLNLKILGASSDFFSNLFYSDFMEKNSGSFRIKEVDETEFVWLMNSLMERQRNVTSVDLALSALTLADRFCMPYVQKHILPYLKATELDPIAENRVAALKRYIDLAVRCRDNGEFVCWIFERCQTTSELIELAQSCGQSVNPHMATFFRFLAIKQSDEEKKTAEKIERLERVENEKDELIQSLISEKE